MTLDERVIYLLIGVGVGFFLGYLTRVLQEIREGVKEVNSFLKKGPSRKRDERGEITWQTVKNLTLLFVVFLTAFAAVQSQIASNKADDNQKQLEQVVGCLIINQTNLLDTVNTRTSSTQTQAKANKTLQESQRVFFGVLLHRPPYTEVTREKAARDYQDALDAFLKAANASASDAAATKYPTAEELLSCIEDKKEE